MALERGARIKTKFGREMRVERLISEGGQGFVYQVYCEGRQMALKWYKPVFVQSIHDAERFKDNLWNNILRGAPSQDFLWPQDLTETVDGCYGYLMELAPREYVSARRIIREPQLVRSFRRFVDACLNIVVAFGQLHDNGFCYQDLSDGNFFINPSNGKVLICDNDNAAPGGADPFVLGTPDFMAPEIVTGGATPTQYSDLHSLAVIIFYLLLLQHPLKGIRSLRMDPKTQTEIFGSDPVFIFDPTDRRNAAIQSPENNALRIWPCLPSHMQGFFVRAFSHEMLHNPYRRPIQTEWVRELVRFRSEIVDCRCGNEVFLNEAEPRTCESCGSLCGSRLRIEVCGHKIPVVNDARVYTCQTMRVCDLDKALGPQVWALASRRDPSDIALRNMSRDPWKASCNGSTLTVAPGTAVRAADGVEFEISGQSVRVCLNEKRQ